MCKKETKLTRFANWLFIYKAKCEGACGKWTARKYIVRICCDCNSPHLNTKRTNK